MNKSKLTLGTARMAAAVVIIVCLASGWLPTVHSSETNSIAAVASTNVVASPITSPVAVKPRLTGAELYSINCNRCHQERYPTERTAAQWKTIMLHMQVRANIPVKQARLILQYLQENSGR